MPNDVTYNIENEHISFRSIESANEFLHRVISIYCSRSHKGPIQIISEKDSGNQLVIYCKDDEYRVYCDVCDNSCIERFYKNHLKSRTYINNIRKREQMSKTLCN